MSSGLRQSDGPRPKAVVVGVQLPDADNAAFEASLRELERLGHTLGYDVIARVTQKRSGLVTASVIGEGKLKELGAITGGTGVIPGYVPPGKEKKTDEEEEALEDAAAEAKAPEGEKAKVVLIDHDLAPNQARNLEKATGAEVLDRSMVILNIFQRHARTREARLQVEIARLAYMAPRMRETGSGQEQRQRGGAVGRSAGESALELDRRKIRDRIAELKKELEIVQRESDTRRSRRLGPETNTVALVGYTNAGKSSLMRALTGDEVYVADQLFATLDTTVRALKPETRPRILVTDTVGFIKKLPHDLVASFRSTLEEAKDASLLLHVVDAADPAFRDQLEVTRKVLEEIGAGENATLLVLNKADKLSDEERDALAAEFAGAMIVSAKRPADIDRLHAHIVQTFEDAMEDAELFVPFSQQRHVALLHERTRVLDERYDEQGTTLRVRAPAGVLGALRSAIGK
jgi:GTP-binding protein HflX